MPYNLLLQMSRLEFAVTNSIIRLAEENASDYILFKKKSAPSFPYLQTKTEYALA